MDRAAPAGTRERIHKEILDVLALEAPPGR
jgi:hypothetical protein